MKRGIQKLMVAIVLMAVLAATMTFAFAAPYSEGSYVVVTDEKHDRLNVHSTPKAGTDNICDHLDKNTVVMYQHSTDGWWYVWYRVGENNYRYGYIDPEYVVATDADDTAKYVCLDGLYVHSTSKIPDGECAAYHTGDKLSAGTKVTVLEMDGTWARIQKGDIEGWVAAYYLKKAK